MDYRNNHYVPVWYQERFLPSGIPERKFFYLDLAPDVVIRGNSSKKRSSVLRWGARRCFRELDLYTTAGAGWMSTEIEEKFFGPVDSSARGAFDYFTSFQHPSVNREAFDTLIRYMSLQKLRTPKGLEALARMARVSRKNDLLLNLQRLQNIYCAIWAESIWCIADASACQTKFLISDHPVTVYNQCALPKSRVCKEHGDPPPWLSGTHTIFPLSLDKVLILTNLSWLRYPYGNPLKPRPNPAPFRRTIFNFTDIQSGRRLSDDDVVRINYVIKARAQRYVAAAEREWLYPELALKSLTWEGIGRNHVLMPDPRCVAFGGEVYVGYEDGSSEAYDAYGRRPWQPGFAGAEQSDMEWETFHAFKGEYARRFGPIRRGRSYEFGRLSPEVDDDAHHKYHLSLERKFNRYRAKAR